VVTSSESGVDYSKSITSYVHDYLGLSRRCRLLEVKQACYGATAMLQLAAGYLASGACPGAKVLIVATDVNFFEDTYAEPATGHGAAAMLVSDQPRILTLDTGHYGTCSFETMDTARPGPTFDIWDVDLSLMSYLECLVDSYRQYLRRRGGTDLGCSFDFIAMHTPFAGMVRAAHRKLMREFAPRPPAEIEAHFRRHVLPSLNYPRLVGNIFSGSLYLALCSIIDSIDKAEYPDGATVGLFSYGSGCASEFFSGTLAAQAPDQLAGHRIADRLANRRLLDFTDYTKTLESIRGGLAPVANRSVDLSGCEDWIRPVWGERPCLVLSGVKDFHRCYQWR
jgi:polyketide biosynthesis 3-hydroxy-3-methylglutaryl-CoA synthase-like enzyme PksG